MRLIRKSLYFALTAAAALSVTAQPGTGIRLDDFTTLTPSLNLSYNYDDNTSLRERALEDESGEINLDDDSDTFIEYLFSLSLNRRIGNRAATASAYFGEEFYQDSSGLDEQKYGASLGYLWASASGETVVDFSGSYQYAVDETGSNEVAGFSNPDDAVEDFENISSRVERDILSSSIAIDQKIGADLGSAFTASIYEVDYANEDFNDSTGYDFEAEVNYQISPKTQAFGQLGMGIDDDEGFADNAESTYFLIGARYEPTMKTRINASIGYEFDTVTPLETTFSLDENREVVSETAPGEEVENDGLKFSINASYNFDAKTMIVLTARNGYSSQGTENSRRKRETAGVLSLRHRTTDQFSQRVGVNWRQDDFLDGVLIDEVEFDEERETISYFYSFSYLTPRPWLSFFGRISFEDGTSNLPDSGNEYDQTRATLGARLSY